ncbi:hypothetical protein CBOM_03646 [Ceraceosorus bombacis]|uniref:Uncharacterized protein n=1 Tax=Ceraceosorus bombacis TaxID=401625 RepID=A0A0P1BH23_9BASI|nr:hypothetical protein CBOM_03646 [Ceraceosorus bombacis]
MEASVSSAQFPPSKASAPSSAVSNIPATQCDGSAQPRAQGELPTGTLREVYHHIHHHHHYHNDGLPNSGQVAPDGQSIEMQEVCGSAPSRSKCAKHFRRFLFRTFLWTIVILIILGITSIRPIQKFFLRPIGALLRTCPGWLGDVLSWPFVAMIRIAYWNPLFVIVCGALIISVLLERRVKSRRRRAARRRALAADLLEGDYVRPTAEDGKPNPPPAHGRSPLSIYRQNVVMAHDYAKTAAAQALPAARWVSETALVAGGTIIVCSQRTGKALGSAYRAGRLEASRRRALANSVDEHQPLLNGPASVEETRADDVQAPSQMNPHTLNPRRVWSAARFGGYKTYSALRLTGNTLQAGFIAARNSWREDGELQLQRDEVQDDHASYRVNVGDDTNGRREMSERDSIRSISPSSMGDDQVDVSESQDQANKDAETRYSTDTSPSDAAPLLFLSPSSSSAGSIQQASFAVTVARDPSNASPTRIAANRNVFESTAAARQAKHSLDKIAPRRNSS